MLLLIIELIGLSVGITLMVLGNVCLRNSSNYGTSKNPFVRLKDAFVDFVYDYDDTFSAIGTLITILVSLIILLSIGQIILVHSNQEAAFAQKQATYEALVFKAESEAAKDEFGLLNKEIIDEIQAWNEDVIFTQKSLDNIWENWYYAPYYKELKTIDLNSFQ